MFVGWSNQMQSEYEVVQIPYSATKDWILNIHYAKRMPSISFAYGLYHYDEMVGMVSYGTPASPSLCKGICGEEHKHNVIELNRLVLKDNLPNQASFLVSRSLKLLPKPRVVVSYADTAQDHAGIIYQACNFLFTGTTKARTDIAGKDGRHSRHHLGDRQNRINRSAKHRYVYFIGSKKDKKTLRNALRYTIEDTYPKLYQE
tara:strand:- start:383 stop:988 length:606 start_codon:yes stop_codon:yes gene_type:complete